jgi:hypothetical protein
LRNVIGGDRFIRHVAKVIRQRASFEQACKRAAQFADLGRDCGDFGACCALDG